MTKIDRKLLQKFFTGTCSEDEKKRVEAWLVSGEYDEPLTIRETAKEQYKKLMWENISADMDSGNNVPVIPLYKRLARYAATACIIFAAFFGGRFSAGTANANPVADKSPKDHLYIYGANGSWGHLPGQSFKVRFDGVVRLYNGSQGLKSIQVGDTSLVLESYQTYYLGGSEENPTLLNDDLFPFNKNGNARLKGNFSIFRADK